MNVMRTQGWKTLRWFCFGACVAVPALTAQAPPVIAVDAGVPGVEVFATVEAAPGSASDAADWADTATFHIRDRNGEQQVGGGDLQGPWTDAAYRARLQKAVSWHPPYLIVVRYCTGNAWACNGSVVFRVRNGVAVRLGYLGGEFAQLDSDRRIRTGRFREVYDRFEAGLPGTTILSHAAAPGLIVSLKDTRLGLVVDRRATCSDSANALPSPGEPPPQASPDGDVEPYLSRLARRALILRYCDRSAELARTLQLARRTLSEKNFRALSAAMDQVAPFEAPFQSRMRE
jgi:hypothetical protein